MTIPKPITLDGELLRLKSLFKKPVKKSNKPIKMRKVQTLGMYRPLKKTLTSYDRPQRLTKCRYELTMFGRVRKVITTDIFNREVVLRELLEVAGAIQWMYESLGKSAPYLICVTDDKKREVLINSCNPRHVKFIQFLCPQESSTKQ